MKRLVVKNIQNCTGCGNCERACAKAYYKAEIRDYSCIRVKDIGTGSEIRVCTQCGKCADVCPVEAIRQNPQGVYMIDRKVCIGCLACADICPEDVICKSHDNIFATKCTACGLCVRACENDVIQIET